MALRWSGQDEVCRRVGATPHPVTLDSKVGVAANISDDAVQPLNGLRHPTAQDANGWYLWRGEALSPDPDFFRPVHSSHLEELCPEVIRYLALPPGWRFLFAPGHEDIWYDASLLEV